MTRPRASTPCAHPGCPQLTPCEEHPVKSHGWDTSTRKTKLTTTSGWAEQRRAKRLLRQHRGICHVCNQPGADQIDHVLPLAQGGTDTEANLRPIHAHPCHERKTESEKRAGRGVGRDPHVGSWAP